MERWFDVLIATAVNNIRECNHPNCIQNEIEKARCSGLKLARLAIALEQATKDWPSEALERIRASFASYDISFKLPNQDN